MRYVMRGMNNFIIKTRLALVNSFITISNLLKRLKTRSSVSYLLMIGFILFTSIGAGMASPALGFLAAGVTCGIFGFLLGLE